MSYTAPPQPKEDIPETEYSFADKKAYQKALKSAPRKEWIKSRDLGNKKFYYVPIEVQQATAEKMFDSFSIVDEQHQVFFNEIVVKLKIQYTPSYPYAEMLVMTGSASKPIQMDAKSDVSLFPKGKKANALEYCLNSARISALSNCFETIGNIFGRNLNRKVSAGFSLETKANKKQE